MACPDRDWETKVTLGIEWFILGAVLTYLAYYIVPILAGTMQLALMQVLFWVGLLIVWGLTMIVTPIYMIIQAFSEGTQEEM